MTDIAVAVKICSKCKENPQAYPDSGSVYCKPCIAEYGRKRRLSNPEPLRAASRRSHLKSRYGLTEEKYGALLEAQDGVCKCCAKPPQDKRLAVDHDHSCCPGRITCGNCVRALLCDDCNLLVGRFETGQLDKIFAYLGVTVHG